MLKTNKRRKERVLINQIRKKGMKRVRKMVKTRKLRRMQRMIERGIKVQKERRMIEVKLQ